MQDNLLHLTDPKDNHRGNVPKREWINYKHNVTHPDGSNDVVHYNVSHRYGVISLDFVPEVISAACNLNGLMVTVALSDMAAARDWVAGSPLVGSDKWNCSDIPIGKTEETVRALSFHVLTVRALSFHVLTVRALSFPCPQCPPWPPMVNTHDLRWASCRTRGRCRSTGRCWLSAATPHAAWSRFRPGRSRSSSSSPGTCTSRTRLLLAPETNRSRRLRSPSLTSLTA